MKRHTYLLCLLFLLIPVAKADARGIFLEAESFEHPGGWVIDQQFMDEMGSPYLLAHGMGIPVENAYAHITLPHRGIWYIYVRTYNWTSPWYNDKGPGAYEVMVDGKAVSDELGTTGDTWLWQPAGHFHAEEREVCIELHDLTGFDGRCDALWITNREGDLPPTGIESLQAFRRKALKLPNQTPIEKGYDLVVCGGGTAGISAAVAAARLGCRVALINDRPVLGGNNSSEIRVHTSGHINVGPYPRLGDLQREFNPRRGGNAQPADYYEDQRKQAFVDAEENITLYAGWHVSEVVMQGSHIQGVVCRDIVSGQEKQIEGTLFADCTGDGAVGFLAGADYRMGRESRDEFGEPRAPEQADSMTLGASVMWYSQEQADETSFPEFSYGITFTDESCEPITMGEWTWETGMYEDKTSHFERVRDYGMLVVYSNWSWLKNHYTGNHDFSHRSLGWVAYVAGKRESRRLMGDYILKQTDITHYALQEDGTCATSWPMDLHFPDPKNSQHFPGKEFKAININTDIHPYPIPYRCLYSRNIGNLFMAGRDISVSHIVHGSIRVMRTTGMMGEVVGMAASICKQHDALPRDIYLHHFGELQALMRQGVGKPDLPDNQRYNENYILPEPPVK